MSTVFAIVTACKKVVGSRDLDFSKVHRCKGRALFIVYLQPSKNKLDRLRNKKYLFTFTYCFITNPAPPINKLFVLISINKMVNYLIVFYVPLSSSSTAIEGFRQLSKLGDEVGGSPARYTALYPSNLSEQGVTK